jgi:hypothetical protein
MRDDGLEKADYLAVSARYFDRWGESVNLIKVYVILFRRSASGSMQTSDEALARNSINRVCRDVWSIQPAPEIKIERGDPQHFRNDPNLPGGGMNQYAIDFLKRKISEGEDPDYFHVTGYKVYVDATTFHLTGDGTLNIRIYQMWEMERPKKISEIHVFVEGQASPEFVNQIVRTHKPELLDAQPPPRITGHNVGMWPRDKPSLDTYLIASLLAMGISSEHIEKDCLFTFPTLAPTDKRIALVILRE